MPSCSQQAKVTKNVVPTSNNGLTTDLGYNEEKELLSIHKNSFFPLCSLGIALLAANPCYLPITPKSFSMPNPFFRALPFFLFLLRTLLTFCLAFAKLEARQRTGCRYLASK